MRNEPANFVAGEDERTDYYRHATKLGPGPEALLGLVEGALRRGDGQSASVFAAACRQDNFSLSLVFHCVSL